MNPISGLPLVPQGTPWWLVATKSICDRGQSWRSSNEQSGPHAAAHSLNERFVSRGSRKTDGAEMGRFNVINRFYKQLCLKERSRRALGKGVRSPVYIHIRISHMWNAMTLCRFGRHPNLAKVVALYWRRMLLYITITAVTS